MFPSYPSPNLLGSPGPQGIPGAMGPPGVKGDKGDQVIFVTFGNSLFFTTFVVFINSICFNFMILLVSFGVLASLIPNVTDGYFCLVLPYFIFYILILLSYVLCNCFFISYTGNHLHDLITYFYISNDDLTCKAKAYNRIMSAFRASDSLALLDMLAQSDHQVLVDRQALPVYLVYLMSLNFVFYMSGYYLCCLFSCSDCVGNLIYVFVSFRQQQPCICSDFDKPPSMRCFIISHACICNPICAYYIYTSIYTHAYMHNAYDKRTTLGLYTDVT